MALGLTDKQQAYVMLFAILLATWTPVIMNWANNGMPTDRLSLGVLFAELLGGFSAAILVFIKEALGITPPTTTTQQQTAAH